MSTLETTDTAGQAPRTWLHRFVRFVTYMVKSHRFFIRESYPYSGTSFIRHPFQWLRAYCRFMWSSTKDGFHQANELAMPAQGVTAIDP